MNFFGKMKILCACSAVAKFECHCKAQIQYFCSNCSSKHIEIPNLAHKLQTISIAINDLSSSALINFIKDSLNNINTIKTSISAKMHKIFLALQGHANTALKGISLLRKNLKSLLNILINSPQNICEWNIKRILAQDLQDTIEDLSTWELYSVNFNIEAFEIPWVIFENNYENCVSYKKLEPSYDMKSMIKAKQPIKPAEKNKISSIEIKEIFTEENKLEINKRLERKELVLYCEKNHKLVWSYIVPLEYFLLRGNRIVQCNFCGKEFSRPCWHCSQCVFDVCEECGTNQGIACPKLVCDNGHELLWKCTVAENYKSASNNNSWRCNNCRCLKSTSSWNCNQCKYDICQQCAFKKEVPPIELKSKCILNHNLIQEKHIGKYKCKSCSDYIMNIGHSCFICNFHVCVKCFKNYNLDIPQNPILSCFNKHLLRWNTQRQFGCNACARNMQSSFHCMSCNYDLCFACADYLEDVVRLNIIRTDNNKHQLMERFMLSGSNNYVSSCGSCNKQFVLNNLVFSCEICKFYICITCFKNNRVTQKIRNTFKVI
ncbi:hypothetical protein SteCoe_352 [Stentor coeruleus]|uniref:Uncharacterized protein n=1 Tax=Stentor coeruleus TaxID=5963 RepID=A0A1R2D4I5_9CILI|nr:hypothetical protein SteCoe_352 [Stentor coeruleus]